VCALKSGIAKLSEGYYGIFGEKELVSV